jgi:hypothetical protein
MACGIKLGRKGIGFKKRFVASETRLSVLHQWKKILKDVWNDNFVNVGLFFVSEQNCLITIML